MLIAEESAGRSPHRHTRAISDEDSDQIAVFCDTCNSSITADEVRYLPQECPTAWTRVSIQVDAERDVLSVHLYPRSPVRQRWSFHDLQVSTLLESDWRFTLSVVRSKEQSNRIVGVIHEPTAMEVAWWRQVIVDLGIRGQSSGGAKDGDTRGAVPRKPDSDGRYVYMIRRVNNPNYSAFDMHDGTATQSKFRLEVRPTTTELDDAVFKRVEMCPNQLLPGSRNNSPRLAVRYTPHPMVSTINQFRYKPRPTPTRWVPVVVSRVVAREVKGSQKRERFVVTADTEVFHYDEVNMIDTGLSPLIAPPANGGPRKFEVEVKLDQTARQPMQGNAIAGWANIHLPVLGWELLYRYLVPREGAPMLDQELDNPMFAADGVVKMRCRRVSNRINSAIEFDFRNPRRGRARVDSRRNNNGRSSSSRSISEVSPSSQDGSMSGSQPVFAVYPGTQLEQVESPQTRERRRVRFSQTISTIPPPSPPRFG